MVKNIIKLAQAFCNKTTYGKSLLQYSCHYGFLRISSMCFCSTNSRENVKYSNIPVENIRNFCIIAHVDHGKSTLADRLLEVTGAISKSKDNKQVLDRLPVEKERGITVKAVTASLLYNYENTDYLLNLIDTPGHVDFSNEVSRSLHACQGVILLVDANEGIQAQTVSNFNLAFTKELTIIPVLNKIDLSRAKPDAVEKELESLFAFDKSSILRISAKTGLGIEKLLQTIIEKIPSPNVSRDPPFKALLIDSWFNAFRGTLLFIYVTNGEIRVEDPISSHKTGKNYTVKYLAELTPEEKPIEVLKAGQVGVIGCNLRTPKGAVIGDTLYSPNDKVEPIESFSSAKPMVFAGLYPCQPSDHDELKLALEKLCLNDPSVTVELDTSPALGFGWRLGFLGLLHLDVFRQRLEQEQGADAILTAPSITYKVKIKGAKNIKEYKGEIIEINNPIHFPSDELAIEETFEPIVLATIITPVNYFEKIIDECTSRRGVQESTTPLESNRIMMKYKLPLSEILFDFHDKIKSLSSGYASFDYEDIGFQSSPVRKMKILLNRKEVEELSMIVHKDSARQVAHKITEKLQESIPRQLVEISIQAVIGSDVLSRKNIKALRKDVTAKLYGGDVTRRMKLLRNQSEGKKKMRSIANIQVDRDTFIDVLRQK